MSKAMPYLQFETTSATSGYVHVVHGDWKSAVGPSETRDRYLRAMQTQSRAQAIQDHGALGFADLARARIVGARYELTRLRFGVPNSVAAKIEAEFDDLFSFIESEEYLPAPPDTRAVRSFVRFNVTARPDVPPSIALTPGGEIWAQWHDAVLGTAGIKFTASGVVTLAVIKAERQRGNVASSRVTDSWQQIAKLFPTLAPWAFVT